MFGVEPKGVRGEDRDGGKKRIEKLSSGNRKVQSLGQRRFYRRYRCNRKASNLITHGAVIITRACI